MYTEIVMFSHLKKPQSNSLAPGKHLLVNWYHFFPRYSLNWESAQFKTESPQFSLAVFSFIFHYHFHSTASVRKRKMNCTLYNLISKLIKIVQIADKIVLLFITLATSFSQLYLKLQVVLCMLCTLQRPT